jgi:hypothetical protein
MTILKKNTHATHATKSVHASDSASPSTEATASPTTAAGAPAPTSATLSSAAQAAVTLIRQAQALLPLTAGPGAKARKNATALQNMPSELLTEAASFLASNGDRYPYDAQAVHDAAQLESQLNLVISSAQALISRAQGTVLEKRGPAVEQALALYATLKAQSRTDASVRDTVTRMEPLVNTRKTPHQKKQQRTKAKVKKITELGGVVAEAGAGSASATASVTAPAAATVAAPATVTAPATAPATAAVPAPATAGGTTHS